MAQGVTSLKKCFQASKNSNKKTRYRLGHEKPNEYLDIIKISLETFENQIEL